MFLVIGGLLVISGMVLNALLSGDAEAQGGVPYETKFNFVSCKGIVIKDENGRHRGYFGLSKGDAALTMYGDDGKSTVAYLGRNAGDPNNEMMFTLKSKSKTDKREASMGIDENGGRFDGHNKMGTPVAFIGVTLAGGGGVVTKDKFGYVR